MNGLGNTCVQGNCRVDSDCGPGYCSPSVDSNGCTGLVGYYCHTPSDECIDDADCSMKNGPMGCMYSTAQGRWTCQTIALCG
jgi:hypothetical protein